MLDIKKIFDENFGLVEAKALLKEIKAEEKNLLKKQELEFKIELNKAEKDLLKTLTGLKTKFLSLFVKVEYMMDYLSLENKNFWDKFEYEKNRANEFLLNKEEAEKAGWYYSGGNKQVLKENEQKQFDWCNKAYPKIKPDLWLIKFEEELLISYMKSFS
jgi:ribosomal protein L14E/L6E/L27E